MQIYIHHNGQQLGPFTETEVKAQLASGAISIDDHVWWEGQANWVPLGQSSVMATPSFTPPLAPLVTPPAATPGTPSVTYAQSVALPQTSGLAITSLVCGLVGLPGLMCYCIGVVFSLCGVVFGHIALSSIKKNPAIQGKGMAVAGLVTGYIGVVLVLLLIICGIVLGTMGFGMEEFTKRIKEQQAIIEKKAQEEMQKDSDKDNGGSTNAAPVVDP